MTTTPTTALCGDCPPVGYPTDKTRCAECPRRAELMSVATTPTPAPTSREAVEWLAKNPVLWRKRHSAPNGSAPASLERR